MLISMPTGTSTILGVFQAILALLVRWDELALSTKVLRKEKFASEIFCYLPHALCCSAKGIHGFVRSAVKPKTDQQVQNGPCTRSPASAQGAVAGARIGNLQDDAGSLTGALKRSGF
jgi:hypothetical protein